ncbi:hypothetical protein [Microbacterium sp. 1P06AB]|uniref:hypothetical protein n=1 Tax=Microbacterium sp. 1P06AB TaxID=3132289 RepID=UPI0039A71E38
MTSDARKLLDLTLEYSAAKDAKELSAGLGIPVGRELDEIAADYAEALNAALRD